jgi:hypothetical protein
MSTNSRPSSIRDPKSPLISQNAWSPRSPALPHFDDHPAPQATLQEVDPPLFPEPDDENEIPYPEPGSEQTLLPPPNFNPFFTLIEDSTSGEHYHPYVHYVFADDDPVIMTAAAMRGLGLDDTEYLPQTTPPQEEERRYNDDGEEEQQSDGQVESPLPPPIPGVKERYMIIDVAADGHTIVDAQSLSSEWQITNTTVRTAPSFDEGSPDHGYMLRIEGVEIPSKNKGKAKGQPGESKLRDARDRSQGDVFAALDGLVKGIEGGLEVAGKIVGVREEDVRESERTVLDAVGAETEGNEEDKSKLKAAETCDY